MGSNPIDSILYRLHYYIMKSLKIFILSFVLIALSFGFVVNASEAKYTYKKVCTTNTKTHKKICKIIRIKKVVKSVTSEPTPILSWVVSTGSSLTTWTVNTGSISTGSNIISNICKKPGIVTWLSTYIQTTYSLDEKNKYCDSLMSGAVYGNKNDYGNHVCVCK